MLPNSSTTMAMTDAAGAHLDKRFARELALGHDEQFAQQAAQIERLHGRALLGAAFAVDEKPEHVLNVYEAKDVIERGCDRRASANAAWLRRAPAFRQGSLRRGCAWTSGRGTMISRTCNWLSSIAPRMKLSSPGASRPCSRACCT